MRFERFEIGPSPEQPEVLEMNDGYILMKDIKEMLQAKDIAGVETKIDQLRATEKFIEQNLPLLTKEQKTCPDGFYSPAHMMANAVKLVEKVLSKKDPEGLPLAISAADQAMRLMSHGVYEKSARVFSFAGAMRSEKFILPNLIEIPDSWKRTPDGQNFSKQLREFIERRQQNNSIEQIDFDLLNNLSNLISKCYEGMRADKEKVEQSPYARELILINLALLGSEAKKYKGQPLPMNETNVNTIQLIKGLYNYNERAELEQRIRPNVQLLGLPKIVEQPRELLTYPEKFEHYRFPERKTKEPEKREIIERWQKENPETLRERTNHLKKILYSENGITPEWIKKYIFLGSTNSEVRAQRMRECGYDPDEIYAIGEQLLKEWTELRRKFRSPKEDARFRELSGFIFSSVLKEGKEVLIQHSPYTIGLSYEIARQAKKALAMAIEESPQAQRKIISQREVSVTPQQIEQYISERFVNAKELEERVVKIINSIETEGGIPEQTARKRKQYRTAFELLSMVARFGI